MMKVLLLSLAAAALAGPALAAPGDPAPPTGTTAAPAATPAAERPTRTGGGIMRYDANKDGVVDKTEWNAGQEARFRQLDADRDGKLNQAELFARTPAVGNSVLPSDRQAQRQSSYFERMDNNKDGGVSLAEFMAQADRNFNRCDVNKDGRTDAAECRQALQRNR